MARSIGWRHFRDLQEMLWKHKEVVDADFVLRALEHYLELAIEDPNAFDMECSQPFLEPLLNDVRQLQWQFFNEFTELLGRGELNG